MNLFNKTIKTEPVPEEEIDESSQLLGFEQYKILKWMITHPTQLHNTNMTILSRSMNLDIHSKLTTPEDYIKHHLRQMLKKGWIVRKNGTKRADFAINWLCPTFPTALLKEYMPGVEQRLDQEQQVDASEDELKDNPEKELEPQPDANQAENSDDEADNTDEVKDNEDEKDEEDDEEDRENFQILKELLVAKMLDKAMDRAEPQPPVEVKKDGGNISLTININLNGLQ